MNALIFVTLMCLGLVSASGWASYDDGSYKGDGYNGLAHIGGGYAGLHKYGPAPLAHDGRVVDTPEVAHAKAAHLAAHAAAAHAAPAHGAWAGYGAPAHGGWAPAPAHGGWAPAPAAAHGAYGYGKWNGPIAQIELTHDGKYVKDTPEVAHAKAAHAAAFSAAAHAAAAQPDYYGHGPAHGSHGW